MSNPLQLESPTDFLSHIQNVDEMARQTIIAELYSTLLLKSTEQRVKKYLSSYKREVVQLSAVVQELRRDISNLHDKNAELLQKSAVDQFRLAESKKSNIGQTKNQLPSYRQEYLPNLCFLKLMINFGRQKTLYPALQRHIRIALAQNYDSYENL
ncbi:hypothetical protein GcM3_064030 [Golovinomyces cichoracearum]|uniref:Uncharacterized protein n=1 Tax=Golovinomyces cichoracearum TaxID=62708 RepID=A0A420IV84_9PEZI|nr:hypothetical protein GcM3_064030 [Golovinomyces cichoracearum]